MSRLGHEGLKTVRGNTLRNVVSLAPKTRDLYPKLKQEQAIDYFAIARFL